MQTGICYGWVVHNRAASPSLVGVYGCLTGKRRVAACSLSASITAYSSFPEKYLPDHPDDQVLQLRMKPVRVLGRRIAVRKVKA
jgi:hypothetical protein